MLWKVLNINKHVYQVYVFLFKLFTADSTLYNVGNINFCSFSNSQDFCRRASCFRQITAVAITSHNMKLITGSKRRIVRAFLKTIKKTLICYLNQALLCNIVIFVVHELLHASNKNYKWWRHHIWHIYSETIIMTFWLTFYVYRGRCSKFTKEVSKTLRPP